MRTDDDIVRAACVTVNPVTLAGHVVCVYCQGNICYCPERMHDGSWKHAGRPIRLADVVLAIGGKHADVAWMGMWDLSHDDLSHQSPETLKFLADLLR